MVDIQTLSQIVADLELDYNLTKEELLPIAVQIQRNQVLQNGLVVSRDNSTPVGLEAIAIALGFNKVDDPMLNSQVSDMADNLDAIREFLEDDFGDFIKHIKYLADQHRQGHWFS